MRLHAHCNIWSARNICPSSTQDSVQGLQGEKHGCHRALTHSKLLPVQVHFFHFVAEEVRIGLAELGLKSLDDLIGRADLLKQREELHVPKTDGLDLSFIMSYAGQTGPSSVQQQAGGVPCPHATLAPSLGFQTCHHWQFLRAAPAGQFQVAFKSRLY